MSIEMDKFLKLFRLIVLVVSLLMHIQAEDGSLVQGLTGDLNLNGNLMSTQDPEPDVQTLTGPFAHQIIQNGLSVQHSTGYVPFGVPIRFTAVYNGFNSSDQVVFEWKDDASALHQQNITAGLYSECKWSECIWSLIYNRGKFMDYIGTRRVTVTVIKNGVRVATRSVDFELTNDQLYGEVVIENIDDKFKLTAEIQGPTDWLRKHSTKTVYVWRINHNDYRCETPSLLISFADLTNYHIQVVVFMNVARNTNTATSTMQNNLTHTKGTTWQCVGSWSNRSDNVVSGKEITLWGVFDKYPEYPSTIWWGYIAAIVFGTSIALVLILGGIVCYKKKMAFPTYAPTTNGII